jgi:hypothetical protein
MEHVCISATKVRKGSVRDEGQPHSPEIDSWWVDKLLLMSTLAFTWIAECGQRVTDLLLRVSRVDHLLTCIDVMLLFCFLLNSWVEYTCC